MKTIVFLLTVISLSAFADNSFRVYNYTYQNKTQKCSVTVFVPDVGTIKVERLCFNLSK